MLMAALLTAVLFAAFISDAPARPLPAGACERYMAAAARRHGVPLPVLYAVGRTESARGGRLHPWTLNVRGRAIYANSRMEALRIAKSLLASGERLFDIGCMQINYLYHYGEFANLWEMFDPARNVDYAARFLKSLYRRHGSWTLAAARYHAGPNNTSAQKRYVCTVIRNLVATGFGRWTEGARTFCGERERLAGTKR